METFIHATDCPGNQRSFQGHRRSRVKKKKLHSQAADYYGRREVERENGEGERDEIEKMVARGFHHTKDILANKVFISGKTFVEGHLNATDKMCLKGDLIVTGKLKCEGNLSLFSGSVWLWGQHPAVTKNLIVEGSGAFEKCKRLVNKSPIENFGDKKNKVIVEEEDTSKSEGTIVEEVIQLLGGFVNETSAPK
ncbi:hypothetical protein F4808DRAFT_459219 [Astrocystis sublimbata]|nr:hypothetical protein F4808DRAFT_459219 [Astrocystis sublimbata]